jgi:hypothetical protein
MTDEADDTMDTSHHHHQEEEEEEEEGPSPMETEEAKAGEGAAGEGGGGAEAPSAGASGGAPPASAPPAEERFDAELLGTLTETMGFSEVRARRGLLLGGGTVEGAVEWISQHHHDDDIDEPIDEQGAHEAPTAQSYLCKDCGKVLSNMANLELHAHQTGHADFEESTEAARQLTDEEKAAKIEQIKRLLAEKRAAREEAEKRDDVQREKARRLMGQEMAKTREQLDIEARKRAAALRKKEKEDFKRERARLRAELAKDKVERASHQGKLASKLGVEGYNPDAIQYDVEPDGEGEQQSKKKKTVSVSAGRLDEYIGKVSSYKAGGDGGKCLKILKLYVSNVLEHPDDPKYRTIKTDNKAYKTKVKPFVGAKQILLAVGFKPEGDALQWEESEEHLQRLETAKTKLEAALVAYG